MSHQEFCSHTQYSHCTSSKCFRIHDDVRLCIFRRNNERCHNRLTPSTYHTPDILFNYALFEVYFKSIIFLINKNAILNYASKRDVDIDWVSLPSDKKMYGEIYKMLNGEKDTKIDIPHNHDHDQEEAYASTYCKSREMLKAPDGSMTEQHNYKQQEQVYDNVE